MEIFVKLKQDMDAHALRDYPRECVGIITRDLQYIPCENISQTPKDTFFLDPAALVKHDGNIYGIFHSHPGSEDPIPSKEDKLSTIFSEYKFLVGFNSNFYIYWYDSAVNALKFEEFKKEHLVITD